MIRFRVLAVVLPLLTLSVPTTGDCSAARPNVLFISMDDLPAKEDLDGRSLVPLLRDPAVAWPHPAITTYDFSEFSIRTERWRYTRYIDDSEELYDHDRDPNEWTNLADHPRLAPIKRRLARHIPTDPAPVAETSYKLSPHHLPPYRSKQEYLRDRKR
ncbi:MAG: sulfatase/phosphatase domain-containing protein [Thermoguttaceae bacterium]